MGSLLRRRLRGAAGLTYIELLVVTAVLLVLAGAIVPIYRWDQKRRNERYLRGDLQLMREAIDLYHKYAEQGLIVQSDVEQMFYPRTLEELVDGVDVGDPEGQPKKIQVLRRIPENPFTGEAEWGLRSYQDDWDSESWGGENVYDVYSSFDAEALDGTRYKDW